MQREKEYNMQRTTYSLVDPFCFQNEPNSEALIFDSSNKMIFFRSIVN
jgi:hypothetical protein